LFAGNFGAGAEAGSRAAGEDDTFHKNELRIMNYEAKIKNDNLNVR